MAKAIVCLGGAGVNAAPPWIQAVVAEELMRDPTAVAAALRDWRLPVFITDPVVGGEGAEHSQLPVRHDRGGGAATALAGAVGL